MLKGITMAFNFNSIVFNDVIAVNDTNYHNPTELEMENGIIPNTQLNSELVNSFLYKCSAAIKQIQENGAINYIPGKIYNKGNIVACNVVINDSISTYTFICNNDNTTEPPLNGLVKNDDYGYVYFTSNEITENWSKVFNKNNTDLYIEIDEFKSSSTEISEDNFKYIQLFKDDVQLNNYNVYNLNSSFKITIYRDNNYLTALINIVYLNDKCILYVDDVLSDNYSMDSTTSIWNSNSVFKNFALLGCFITTGIQDDKPIICFSPRSDNVDITNKKIKVEISEVRGNLPFNLSQPTNNPDILNTNTKKIPFISGASSSFDKSMDIIDTFEELTYQEKFKRGMLLLDVDDIDTKVYYAFKDIQLDSISNFKGRYTSNLPYANYRFANGVYTEKFNNLQIIDAQFCGTAVQVSPESYNLNGDFRLNGSDFVNGSGIWSLDNCDYYNLDVLFSNMLDTSTLIYGPNSNQLSIYTYRYFIRFDASLYNKKYSDDIQNDFELDSTKIYKYINFI